MRHSNRAHLLWCARQTLLDDQLMRFFVKNNAFHRNKISLTDTTIHSLVSEIEIVFDVMLKEYYEVRGWSTEGVPTEEKVRELGL